MARSPRQLYERVKQKPNNCTLKELEGLLTAYGFAKGERGNVQVWTCRHITLTFHKPHKKRGKVKVGAVSQTLAMIDEAISQGLVPEDQLIN